MMTVQYTFDEADTIVANLNQTLSDWGDDMDDAEIELMTSLIESIKLRDTITFG